MYAFPNTCGGKEAAQTTTHLINASSPRSLILTISLCGSTSGLLVTQEHRGSVELVRSSNECIGDFESTEEAFCCPDFRVTTWALCIDPPFAKLIRGCWFATVVVMSERSTEQIRELLDSLYRVDSGRILATPSKINRPARFAFHFRR